MHGPWTHIKAHIYDMERERGQRSVALRRTFNRDIQLALRGGGVTHLMLEWLARQIVQQTPWNDTEAKEAAGNYVYDIVEAEWKTRHGETLPDTPAAAAWARRQAPTLSTLQLAYTQVREAGQILEEHLRAWLAPFLAPGAWRPRWLQLARGVWRAQEAGDFLIDPLVGSRPKEFAGRPFTAEQHRILGVMGDGDCFYRSLGVAMILDRHHINTLIRHLERVQYPVAASSMGLCMVYPKPVTVSRGGSLDISYEVRKWRETHGKLLHKLKVYRHEWGRPKATKRMGTISFLHRILRKFNRNIDMQVALVRALRETTAKWMEENPSVSASIIRASSMLNDYDSTNRTQELSADPRARILDRISSFSSETSGPLVEWFVQNIARQAWEDAPHACIYAALRALNARSPVINEIHALIGRSQTPKPLFHRKQRVEVQMNMSDVSEISLMAWLDATVERVDSTPTGFTYALVLLQDGTEQAGVPEGKIKAAGQMSVKIMVQSQDNKAIPTPEQFNDADVVLWHHDVHFDVCIPEHTWSVISRIASAPGGSRAEPPGSSSAGATTTDPGYPSVTDLTAEETDEDTGAGAGARGKKRAATSVSPQIPEEGVTAEMRKAQARLQEDQKLPGWAVKPVLDSVYNNPQEAAQNMDQPPYIRELARYILRHRSSSKGAASKRSRAAARFTLVTTGILNWLDASRAQNIARMWTLSPLYTSPLTTVAGHYDPSKTPGGEPLSDENVQRHLRAANFRGAVIREPLDVDRVAGTHTVVVDFAHVFRPFPVLESEEGVVHRGGSSGAPVRVHVLRLDAARSAIGRAMLQLPIELLLDVDAGAGHPITFYDKMLRIGMARALMAPALVCEEPTSVLHRFLKHFHNVIFEALRHAQLKLDQIEAWIGTGSESTLHNMIMPGDTLPHVLTVLLEVLNDVYMHQGNVVTYVQTVIRKCLPWIRQNIHSQRGTMTEEEIRHITVKVLDAQSVIERFHRALDRCASGAGDGGGACSSSAPSALAAAKRACARCTFDNHPDNVECDMCGSALPHQS